MTERLPTLADIEAARARIEGKVKRTPVMRSAVLEAEAGAAALCFKCENLQEVGAFKARGAASAVFALSDAEAARGVVTHSSGNHGAALAWAAALRGIAAHVVMPSTATAAKQANTARYGARIVLCEPTLAAREAAAARLAEETGAVFVHPYDDPAVIAGQGTCALELLEQAPELDLVLAPIGGGGLISGTATAVKGRAPATRVVGVEPAGADDALRSLLAGVLIPMERPDTIADGLRASLSERTFAVIARRVDDIVTVSDAEIVLAQRALWEALRMLIEPSAAVPYAAIRAGRIDVRGLRVGIILTGGNAEALSVS
ncbi:MAG: threonine/serine dehydratase [Caulobacteraceae bacterium]|nr:threonine/serine dehydratase [Caulobacteraceae bacterium]